MTAPRALRPPGPPMRVGDLLLPTILTLAGRNTVSAKHFLELLPPGPRSPEASADLPPVLPPSPTTVVNP